MTDDPFSSDDPYSRAPLAGSVSDRPWVQRNATLFHPREAWGALRAVIFILLLVLFAFPLAYVLFGGWGVALLVYAIAAVLVVRIVRKRRRWSRAA